MPQPRRAWRDRLPRGLRPWFGGRRALAAAIVAVLAVTGAIWAGAARGDDAPASIIPTALRVDVGAEPDGTSVTIDADLYLPPAASASAPHPAVLLAHGFGGSKADLAPDARRLAAEGYVVLAYSARGFGGSGGRIHLDDPAFEVADATTLIDTLAARPEVRLDAPGDPRVAVMGGSYGGALALMAAGADERVDSVVALITWNDLSDSFFPQAAVTPSTAPSSGQDDGATRLGPFKALWASSFFTSAIAGGAPSPDQGAGDATAGAAAAPEAEAAPDAALCGRFDPTLCDLFLGAADGGDTAADEALAAELRTHSPAPTLDRVRAPVYLVQGMNDSLFGLDQSDANAAALREAGVPVAVRWFNGGHDGAGTAATAGASTAQSTGQDAGAASQPVTGAAGAEQDDQHRSIDTWLQATLSDPAAGQRATTSPLPELTYTLPLQRGQDAARQLAVTTTDTASAVELPLVARGAAAGSDGGAVAGLPLISPPGGVPAAVTTLPGLGSLVGSAPTYPLAALPGQHVAFQTPPLAQAVVAAGSPTVRLRVTSTAETVTLFVSLWQVQGQNASLPRRLVAPVQVRTTPGRSTEVEVRLPTATWDMPAGSTWRVLVGATDTAYRNQTATRVDQISLAAPTLTVPTVGGTEVGGPSLWDGEALAVAAAILALLLALGIAAVRARVRPSEVRADLADVPLVIEGLSKSYADGHHAVQDVSWRAERGQVVGLLGPNGAGKTTTLRMATGLIGSDGGAAYVLGERVRPGSPVLGRVGTLIEGPGFLPHLTGRDNLLAYWAATGRPLAEAHLDEAADVAALNDAIDRPVKTYSHGMKQRLGIAQAMLGLPEVLILDEPTNGLDPPQIAGLRPILRAYAEAGRTVVVSSHLLAEVELTCSHVVVMNQGKVVAAGSVADVGVAQGRSLESVFLETIAGVREVRAR